MFLYTQRIYTILDTQHQAHKSSGKNVRMVVYLDVSTLESLKLILLRISLHSPWSRDGTRREILAVNLSDVSPLLRLTLVDLVDLVDLWPAWEGGRIPPPSLRPCQLHVIIY